MPRLVFETCGEFLEHTKYILRRKEYTAYITEKDEIILVPVRSTRPVIYCYYKITDEREKEAILDLLESLKVPVFYIKSFDWDAQKPIGAPQKVEI